MGAKFNYRELLEISKIKKKQTYINPMRYESSQIFNNDEKSSNFYFHVEFYTEVMIN